MDVETFRWSLIQMPEQEGITVPEACRRCEVSRKTYYKWKRRFQQEGIDGLKNRSRRPETSPKKTDAAIESEIVRIKTQCPRWRAHRIRNQLLRQKNGQHSTQKEWNFHFMAGKKEKIETLQFIVADGYYGEIYIGCVKIYPISIFDDCSRKILACHLYTRERAKEVVKTLKIAIEQYGSPKQIYTDNGGQFISKKFAKACLKAGIKHIKTSIAHPQGIGKIERWHRNLQEELFDIHTFNVVGEAQPALDSYLEYYNHEQPHMGISECTPHARYLERLLDL